MRNFSNSRALNVTRNMKNMAKRAEAGGLLDKILGTVKAIGKSADAKPSFFSRFGGK